MTKKQSVVSKYRVLALAGLSAFLVASAVFAQASAAGVREWIGRIAAQYEQEAARADARAARTDASMASIRDILSRARASGNAKVEARAKRALANAEALRKRALLQKAAALQGLDAVKTRMASAGARDTGMLAIVPSGPDRGLRDLSPGQAFSTGPGQQADLFVRDETGTESRVRVGPSSRVEVLPNDGGLSLDQGKIRVTEDSSGVDPKTRKQRRSLLDTFLNCLKQADYDFCYKSLRAAVQGKFSVRTPSAVLAERGTDYVLSHDESTGQTTLAVLEGSVVFLDEAHGRAVLVEAGRAAATGREGAALLPAPVDLEAESLLWEQ